MADVDSSIQLMRMWCLSRMSGFIALRHKSCRRCPIREHLQVAKSRFAQTRSMATSPRRLAMRGLVGSNIESRPTSCGVALPFEKGDIMTFGELWYWRNLRLLAQRWRQCDIKVDEDECTWIHLGRFPLPRNFRQRNTDLLLILAGVRRPITVAPRGFYVDQGLRSLSGRGLDHIFDDDGPANATGYAWFCLHLDRWQPSADVVRGDNLVTVTNTIQENLRRL